MAGFNPRPCARGDKALTALTKAKGFQSRPPRATQFKCELATIKEFQSTPLRGDLMQMDVIGMSPVSIRFFPCASDTSLLLPIMWAILFQSTPLRGRRVRLQKDRKRMLRFNPRPARGRLLY